MWLNHGSGLLIGEPALPSMSLHLMPFVMSVTPLDGEDGF
jgi:hypothetical protein